MNKNRKTDQSAPLAGGMVTNELTQRFTERTIGIFEDADQLSHLANKWKGLNSLQSQGHLFEQLETIKFNFDALRKDLEIYAKTNASLGKGTDLVDIVIMKGKGKVIREVQAKSYSTAEKSVTALSESKYGEMQRIAPIEQTEGIKKILDTRIDKNTLKSDEYIQTKRNLSEGLSQDGVTSGGTTRQEAIKVTEQAEADKLASNFKVKSTMVDMHESGIRGGAISAIFGGGITAISEYWNYSKGEQNFGEATANVAVASAKSFATGYTVTALSKGITCTTSNYLGQNFAGIAQSSAPVAISAAIVNTGKSLFSYAKGDIDSNQLFDEISHNAITSTSIFYYGALGQSAIPIPVVGAMVGAGVGWFVANILHQSGIVALGDSQEVKIAKERRRQIEAMCLVAIANIEKNRAELIEIMDKHFAVRKKQLIQSFDLIDIALEEWNPDKYVEGLNRINECFGKTLSLKKFREFDSFMHSDEKFVL